MRWNQDGPISGIDGRRLSPSVPAVSQRCCSINGKGTWGGPDDSGHAPCYELSTTTYCHALTTDDVVYLFPNNSNKMETVLRSGVLESFVLILSNAAKRTIKHENSKGGMMDKFPRRWSRHHPRPARPWPLPVLFPCVADGRTMDSLRLRLPLCRRDSVLAAA